MMGCAPRRAHARLGRGDGTDQHANAGDRTQMPERRFNETEVAAILERATAVPQGDRQTDPGGAGLTLAQLQEIGRDVGVAPHAIADAAAALDAREPTTRRFLGLPLGVERVVPLPRRLSDEEWERVVVDLREVFDARGVMRQDGSLRQWSNGRLQAHLEPTGDAQRLRIRTVKGNAPGLMTLGLGVFGAAAAALTTMVLNGSSNGAGEIPALAMTAAAGAGVAVSTALRLIPWARRRRAQMAEVAARVARLGRAAEPRDVATRPDA